MDYLSRASAMEEEDYLNKRASMGRNMLQSSDMRGRVYDKKLQVL